LGLKKVSKNCPYSDQIGRQIDHQIMFLERSFLGAAQPNLMIDVSAAVTWCDVALPLFGSGRLDQTGSICKAGLIAVF
jgi:hypothetical protein